MGRGCARLKFDFVVAVSVGGEFIGLRLVERFKEFVVMAGDFCCWVDKVLGSRALLISSSDAPERYISAASLREAWSSWVCWFWVRGGFLIMRWSSRSIFCVSVSAESNRGGLGSTNVETSVMTPSSASLLSIS